MLSNKNGTTKNTCKSNKKNQIKRKYKLLS